MKYKVNGLMLRIVLNDSYASVTTIEFETKKQLHEFLIELLKDTSAINY